MSHIDLNLLAALKALIDEQSVARAARRLHLSPSAMSRTLGRVQRAFGDDVLVRAGKSMVVTVKARALKGSLDQVLRDIDALVRGPLEGNATERVMSISANDGFIDTFAAPIVAAAYEQWPHIKIRFVAKNSKTVELLREGEVDLEIGVIGNTGPEIVVTKLFDDRMVAVVRKAHPLCKGDRNLQAYLSFPHISVSRKGLFHGPIDEALIQRGLARNVIAVVPHFSSALELARHSDWIAHVPERHTAQSRKGMTTFKIPIATPPLIIRMMWHPRLDQDRHHKNLRELIMRICRREA